MVRDLLLKEGTSFVREKIFVPGKGVGNMKLKYGMKLAGQIYPKGTVVECISSKDSRITDIFPNIKRNDNSTQIAVIFPGRSTITILQTLELEGLNG